MRARPQARSGPAAHPQAARRPRHPALPVPQQDRQLRHAGARHPADPAACQHEAAGAAADPDLGKRNGDGFRRPRARAGLRLPQAEQRRGHRDAGGHPRARNRCALQDARDAGRLRRRAHGAAPERPAARPRKGLQGPRRGDAELPDRAGAAGLGGKRQRHPAPPEGAQARSALRRSHGAPAQAREREVRGAGAEGGAYGARRQALSGPRHCRRIRRGHARAGGQGRGAGRLRLLDAGPGGQEAGRGQGR